MLPFKDPIKFDDFTKIDLIVIAFVFIVDIIYFLFEIFACNGVSVIFLVTLQEQLCQAFDFFFKTLRFHEFFDSVGVLDDIYGN